MVMMLFMAPSSTDVLCVGMNDAAMETRRLILEKAGYRVTQAHDLRRVKAEYESNSFSIVILVQSRNGSEKKRITDVLLMCRKTAKILELHSAIAPELPEADAHLQVTASEPEGLVEAVTALLKMPRKKKAHR